MALLEVLEFDDRLTFVIDGIDCCFAVLAVEDCGGGLVDGSVMLLALLCLFRDQNCWVWLGEAQGGLVWKPSCIRLLCAFEMDIWCPLHPLL